ncbi:MAG: TonB-dependent receptor, partial [Gemmatimonadaceae bacterium]|nr:TonB-dependent receptor [Chitinophagaceae bacterium]
FLYENQTDNYQQDHYQAFYNHKFDTNWSFNTAVFLTKGKGYYEEFKKAAKYSSYGLPNFTVGNETVTRTDLVRQLWLDNNFYGGIFSLIRKGAGNQLTIGGGWNQYDGKHYGRIPWAMMGIPKNFQNYYYEATKKDLNVFVKYQQKLTENLEAYGDLQYRTVNYNIGGTRKFPDLKTDNTFHFFNPKAGLTYTSGSLIAYASYAMANKEPNRNDFETGTAVARPKREQLHDVELGIETNKYNYAWGVNGYFMRYKDQLVLTGKINDVGDAVRINVPNSYRLGVELQGRYRIGKILQVSGNLTLSENKVLEFTDNVPRYDANFDLIKQDSFFYKKTTMAFSPAVTGSGLVQLFPFANAEIDLISKYVGEQYLDNSMNDARKIQGYFVQDLRLQYNLKIRGLKEVVIIGQLSNVWNKNYEANGYTYSYIYNDSPVTENFYFPMAGRNAMIGVNVKL